MRFSLVLASAAVFVLAASPIAAQTIGRFGNSDYATYQDPLISLRSHGVPTAPLQKGSRHLKIVPAYVTSYSRGGAHDGTSLDRAPTTGNISWLDQDARGFGTAVTWLHGLSDHWGYSVSATVLRMTGKTFAFAEYNAGNSLVKRHDASESGIALQSTAMLIYDPFTSPDGFRLPLFAGFGVLYQNQTAEYRAPSSVLAGNPTIKFKSGYSVVLPGVVLGASAHVHTGPLRWTPFLAVQFKSNSTSSESVVTNETTGAVLSRQRMKDGSSTLPALGLGIIYKPWELGFTWTHNVAGTSILNHSIYTLSKTFKWGEADASGS